MPARNLRWLARQSSHLLPERISVAGYKAREAPEIPQKEKYGKRTMHDDKKDRKLIKCWFCSSPDKEVFHAVKQASEQKPERKQRDDKESQ
jgi:hypothetical protein